MKKTIRKICAVALATGMVLPMAACRSKSKKNDGKDESKNAKVTDSADKGKTSGASDNSDGSNGGNNGKGGSTNGYAGQELKKNEVRTVKAGDSYYTTKTAELQLKVPDDKKVALAQFNTLTSAGGIVLANVHVDLEMPESIEKELNSLNLDNDYSNQRYQEIMDEYSYNSLQFFDMDGNNLNEIKLSEECQFYRAFDIGNGEILVVTHVMNWETCVSVPQLFVVNTKGEKVRDFKFDDTTPLDHMSVYYIDNGNLIVCSEGKFCLVDNQGKKINEVSNKNLNGQMLNDGGKWYAVFMMGNKPVVQEIDVNTGDLVGKEFPLDNLFYSCLQDRYDGYGFDETGVSRYDIANNTRSLILPWADTEVNFGSIETHNAVIESEDSMIFFKFLVEGDIADLAFNCSTDLYARMAVVQVKRCDTNPNEGKTVLKLGMFGVNDSTFLDKISEFNSDPNSKARIEVVDYTKHPLIGYAPEEVAQIMKESTDDLLNDLYAGTGPDILVGFSQIYDFTGDKTLLDLKTYLDSDSSINKNEYYENIFSAFEEDGKMYSIPLTYTLEGMAVNSFYEGAKDKWTYTDAQTMKEKLPQTMDFLPKYESTDLLVTWMSAQTSKLVDNDKRTVDFESDAFRNLLETTKVSGNATTTPNAGSRFGASYRDYYEAYADGEFASCVISLRDLADYSLLKEPKKGDKTIFTGYPTQDGSSMMAGSEMAMSITSCASDPDAAWEFICFFLEEENQRALSYNSDSLPVNKNAFKSNCTSEITKSEETYAQYESNPSGFGSKPFKFTQEDANALEALITSVASCKQTDAEISGIIVDEAKNYLAGWREVDDTVRNIQKRSSIAVQER